ncbi:MAG TPA: DUF4199 domain-containing protein [Cyclobacteriaceae bacterium]|jgi:hypothetical protein|nr:DUF4199 domain-containing protein [Cyclobacteriaceae bacterium]
MRLFSDPEQIPQSYGLRIAVGLIGYFLIMQILGYAHVVELRLLNLFILVAGVWYALKRFRETHPEMNYFRALVTGVATAAIGALSFAAFLFIYMISNDALMQAIVENEPMGRFLNPYIVACIVALEGLFSGLLVTFILINYVETAEVNRPIG